MTFTQVFGGTTIYPASVSYRAISLSVNQTLSWPTETATNSNVVAQIMDVTPSIASLSIIMPPANEASVGETALFFNAGSFSFTVTDYNGNTIISVAPGLSYQVYMTSNSTVNGTWRSTQYGAGTSSVSAGSLVGAGIKAINTTLNQSMSVTTLNSNYSIGNSDRSAAFVWTGGAGSLTLPSSGVVGNDWFCQIRNGGTGAVTISPTGGNLINGAINLTFNPGDSAIVVCDGSAFFTIGFGQSAAFSFDYVSIDLTGQTSPYSLSGANLNRISYSFGGTLTANMVVYVPATIQQYWISNETSGSFTLTVKVAGQTGVEITQGARGIYYCNGTDLVDADTGSFAFPVTVAQGGTGSTTAAGARVNLGGTSIGIALFTAPTEADGRTAISAAKLGANSDITSLSGLTTALSVAQGGTGASTLTSNGVLYGSGTATIGATSAGTTGQVLVANTGAAPSWATLTGIGVTSFSAGTTGLTPSTATTGAVTLSGTLAIANGGTGATSAAAALTSLGAYPASNPSGFNVGTVTSVAALTLGTAGTDLSSTVANGTTTPVITLNVPTASALNRGALSSTDWSTFNNKQAALVSGTNIKTVGGVTLLGSGDVNSIGTATNLAGGASGSIPYQSGAGATTFLASGTGVLVTSGGNPSYTMTPSLTQVTVAADPTTNLEVATKQYVDTLAVGSIHYHTPVKYAAPAALTVTYNQPGGAGVGVGATLTNAGALAAFAPDGPTASVGDRILIYNQASALQNGIYTVTTVGSGSVAWVLTRATDADTYSASSNNGLGQGDAFFVLSGDTGAGETYVMNTTGVITFGTTAISFVLIADTAIYSAGTGLTLTGTVFSLTAPVATSLGGTGLTSFTSGGAVYATSTSALTTGTLPVTAGGTGATTLTGYIKGSGTSAFTASSTIPASDVVSSALTKTDDTNVTLTLGGSPTTALLAATSLTLGWTGQLSVARGGTGAATLTGIVVGNGTSAFTTVTAPSGTIVGTTDTQALTNKRVTPRMNSQTTTTSPWAWNSDSYDIQAFTALANALTINADAGTPTDGQRAIFRFKDNGTARALTWTTGATKAFRAVGVTLPTTTVISKTVYVGCLYNSADSRWDAVAVSQEA
jgi:hypothetical protein